MTSGMGLGCVKTPKLNLRTEISSTSINLKNKSAGDGCRDKTIEKTILRAFRARTFSRSLGQNRKYSTRANDFRFAPKSGHCATDSACPFRAKTGSDHFGVDLPRPGENHPAKIAQPTHLRLCAAFSASVS